MQVSMTPAEFGPERYGIDRQTVLERRRVHLNSTSAADDCVCVDVCYLLLKIKPCIGKLVTTSQFINLTDFHKCMTHL